MSSRLFYRGKKTHYRLHGIIDACFVVSVDRGKNRFYVAFDSIDDFEEWYVKLSPEERTINEVIKSDMRKLVIDIDSGPNDPLVMYDGLKHIPSRIRDVFGLLEIGVPEVILYRMTDGKGLCDVSYHAVVHNFAFSASTCMGLSMILSSGQPWFINVDLGVYKNIQCMRIAGSTKYKQKRWKWAVSGGEVEFRRGLLSNLEGTVESNFTCALRREIGHVCMSVPNVDLKQFKIVRPHLPGKAVMGLATFIRLQRIRPGYCPQCNRVHDRENAAVIHGKFVCWRSIGQRNVL